MSETRMGGASVTVDAVAERIEEKPMNYARSESIQELVKALVAAQSVMEAAAKDSTNPHFNSRYADLASFFDACKGPLTDNGLALLQPSSATGPAVTVTTLLVHTSGQWISADLTLTADKPGPQAVGSVLSYARRYGLSSLIGIAADDDDGQGATDVKTAGKKAQQEVVNRKLGRQEPEPARPEAPPSPKNENGETTNNFEFLKTAREFKSAIGEDFYRRICRGNGVEKSNQLLTAADQQKFLKALAAAKKICDAASHGEILKTVTEEIWLLLPEASRAAVFVQCRVKLQQLMGDDAGLQETDSIRAKAANQWAAYREMDSSIAELMQGQAV